MVTPSLTPRQTAALAALESAGRTEVVPADPGRAAALMNKVARLLDQVLLLDYPEAQHTLAYNACHAAADALMAELGYRTSGGPGQHEALGLFLVAVIDLPPGDQAAAAFDSLRRTRNASDYRAVPIGQAQATFAVQVAQDLLEALTHRGVGRENT